MNLKLSAPSQIVWIIALILGIVGVWEFWGSLLLSPRMPFGSWPQGGHSC